MRSQQKRKDSIATCRYLDSPEMFTMKNWGFPHAIPYNRDIHSILSLLKNVDSGYL